MQTIETVVFDLGGVLINWDPRNLYRKVFEREEEMEYFLDHVCTGSWNGEQDRGRTFAEAVKLKQKEFPKYHEEIALFHTRWDEMIRGSIRGTVDILKKLHEKRQCRLYALTNWSAETFPYALENFNFLQIFEGILVSGKEILIKPDPEIYKLLFRRYDIDPKAAVFIDDSLKNVEAATGLGMKAIHFRDAEQLTQELGQLEIDIA